ncbi:MAG TPA: hypothetical protein VFW39_12060 [Sphingomicrobium sp.]|nr:hypothetical protein [Sphingomicrobium sp.]
MRLVVLTIGMMSAGGGLSVPAFAQQIAQPAAAQQPVQQTPNGQAPIEVTGTKTADLNAVVCEKEQDTGSRLTSHRVCMTRGQWMEERRQERMDIDRAQVERPMH